MPFITRTNLSRAALKHIARAGILLSLLLVVVSGCTTDDNKSNVSSIPSPTESPVGTITATVVASGLSQPLYVCSPPADSSRLFIIEKSGKIKILRDGQILPSPFLDITDRVNSSASERGLLGLAFHPNYSNNGLFFVNYTNLAGSTTISRFRVSDNPEAAIVSSEAIVLTVPQPYSNHNAGMLAFGPTDGYLYIGLGDGGSGGDPENRAQNPRSMLGKMLRIDIDSATPYAIPANNPYAASQDTLPEIWAFGLRNPWRYSFDRETGDLWIADVGQNQVEEINFTSASSTGGENYGWRLKEGTRCFNPSQNCDPAGTLTDPVFEYLHSDPSSPCSVTGGYVYRGNKIPRLYGEYLFGDFCSGQIWSMSLTGDSVAVDQISDKLGIRSLALASFGEDAGGDIYIVDLMGTVYRIEPTAGADSAGQL